MDWHRVDVPVPSRAPAGVTAVYLSDGPGALLVDPARRTADLDAAVAATDIAHIAVTHHHPDHVGAVAEYARETDATVWARRGRTDAFEAAADITPDRTFAEETVLPAGDGVTVVDLPGHAPEHVGFETATGIVSGDVAAAEGSVVVGAPEGDMRAYLSSLRRLHSRAPDILYPGHGPTITDTRATCQQLIRHRLRREERVQTAVESGAATPDDILDRAYEKELTGVRDLALATVVAHLEKLGIEGAIRWDGDQARPQTGRT